MLGKKKVDKQQFISGYPPAYAIIFLGQHIEPRLDHFSSLYALPVMEMVSPLLVCLCLDSSLPLLPISRIQYAFEATPRCLTCKKFLHFFC